MERGRGQGKGEGEKREQEKEKKRKRKKKRAQTGHVCVCVCDGRDNVCALTIYVTRPQDFSFRVLRVLMRYTPCMCTW